jgi:hypothetical protein
MRRIVTVFVLFVLAAPVLAQPGLVAPVYPGAEQVDESGYLIGGLIFGGHAGQRTMFLLRDELEQVSAFYAGQGMEPGARRSARFAGLQAELRYREVLSQADSRSRLSDYTLARPAGIQLLAIRPREPGVYLGALRESVAKGYHSEAELDEVAGRFAYLESCVFPAMRDENGQWRPADEVLAERYYAQRQGGFTAAATDIDAVAKQIEDLVMQGRMEEAQVLMQQMAAGLGAVEGVATADPWQDGIRFLEELEQNAYRSVLLIDMKPEQWSAP